jgi:tripartite-type tricarboxylate transporter receptor subunit TctC
VGARCVIGAEDRIPKDALDREKRMFTTSRLSIALGLCLFVNSAAYAAEYPSGPIQIVSSVPIGSATDIIARQVADKLTSHVGGPVIVINKPGAGGLIAADYVAKSPPDGYNLLFGNSALALYPFLYKKHPFDVLADLSGIGLVAESPYVVVVNNDLGVKTMQELLDLAKAKPKAINFASGGVGTGTHVACELLASRAGVQLTHVPYANTMMVASDLQSNTVQMMCSPLSSILPLLSGGRVSVIGVSAPAAMTDPIEVPSVKQSTGVDFIATQWFGLLAPKHTPEPVLQELSKALEGVVGDPDFRQKLKDQALDVHPLYLIAFDNFIAKELKLWKPIVNGTGLKLDD